MRKAEETGADVVGCDYNMTSVQSMQIGKVVPNNTMDQTGILNRDKYALLVMNPGSMVIKIYAREVIEVEPSAFPGKDIL